MLQLKKCYKLFFICHLLLLQVSLVFSEMDSRIVGGTPTTINKVPHLVQLLDNGKFVCGGTIVSSHHVVTAAHCVDRTMASRLSISAGATMLTDAGVRSRVSKIIMPKAYRRSSLDMDVAVLKLSTPIRGLGIRPTGLCNKNWQPGATVQVFGWGLTHENANFVSNQLRTVNVTVIANSICQQFYRYKARLTATMFCASMPGLKDSCSGDSGGGVLINGQFCGLVSWGEGCGRRYSPGVYTSVLAVRKFIINNTKL